MILVVLVLTLTTLALPLTGLCDVRIQKAEVEKALEENDPEALVRRYLIPYLERDPKMAMMFAAELNISNGAPDSRNFGERGMFNMLVDAGYVLDNYQELEPRAEEIFGEAKRLLLGPWKNGGSTVFNFSNRDNTKQLNYLTGKWEKNDNRLPIIRVEHYTEYTNKKRVAYISCDYKNLKEDGYYHAEFSIVRTL